MWKLVASTEAVRVHTDLEIDKALLPLLSQTIVIFETRMDLAWLSLLALVIVIIASCTTRVNPGVLALVFAWIIGVFLAPDSIGIKAVIAGFPSPLFLTLIGVTLLFTQAYLNGTLDKVAHVAVRGCRGNAGLVPIMFFLLASALATIGAGNIAASALIAPMAMTVAARSGIPAFLMTIMVGHGAIAGALSPFSPTGIIARDRMRDIGLVGYEWQIFWHNWLANAAVALIGYLLFGGWRLFRRWHVESPTPESLAGLQRRHWGTLAVIVLLIVGVVGFDLDIGLAALAGSVLLTVFGWADDQEAVRKMPWGVIVMVCGVTVLTALLEKTGGADRLTQLVGAVADPTSGLLVVGLVTGFVSVYSSTSGVVLPAFLPMVPGLIRELGGGEPLAFASTIIVSGHLVDSSPLSTIGALCVAGAGPTEDRRLLFMRTLFWGMSMVVVGALLCYVFFGLL
ncbi:MAG TPA: SLC13 family permease [Gemmataceae bacterium]|nr:SLC13 family permease [Gemmataceae bacterium]